MGCGGFELPDCPNAHTKSSCGGSGTEVLGTHDEVTKATLGEPCSDPETTALSSSLTPHPELQPAAGYAQPAQVLACSGALEAGIEDTIAPTETLPAHTFPSASHAPKSQSPGEPKPGSQPPDQPEPVRPPYQAPTILSLRAMMAAPSAPAGAPAQVSAPSPSAASAGVGPPTTDIGLQAHPMPQSPATVIGMPAVPPVPEAAVLVASASSGGCMGGKGDGALPSNGVPGVGPGGAEGAVEGAGAWPGAAMAAVEAEAATPAAAPGAAAGAPVVPDLPALLTADPEELAAAIAAAVEAVAAATRAATDAAGQQEVQPSAFVPPPQMQMQSEHQVQEIPPQQYAQQDPMLLQQQEPQHFYRQQQQQAQQQHVQQQHYLQPQHHHVYQGQPQPVHVQYVQASADGTLVLMYGTAPLQMSPSGVIPPAAAGLLGTAPPHAAEHTGLALPLQYGTAVQVTWAQHGHLAAPPPAADYPAGSYGQPVSQAGTAPVPTHEYPPPPQQNHGLQPYGLHGTHSYPQPHGQMQPTDYAGASTGSVHGVDPLAPRRPTPYIYRSTAQAPQSAIDSQGYRPHTHAAPSRRNASYDSWSGSSASERWAGSGHTQRGAVPPGEGWRSGGPGRHPGEPPDRSTGSQRPWSSPLVLYTPVHDLYTPTRDYTLYSPTRDDDQDDGGRGGAAEASAGPEGGVDVPERWRKGTWAAEKGQAGDMAGVAPMPVAVQGKAQQRQQSTGGAGASDGEAAGGAAGGAAATSSATAAVLQMIEARRKPGVANLEPPQPCGRQKGGSAESSPSPPSHRQHSPQEQQPGEQTDSEQQQQQPPQQQRLPLRGLAARAAESLQLKPLGRNKAQVQAEQAAATAAMLDKARQLREQQQQERQQQERQRRAEEEERQNQAKVAKEQEEARLRERLRERLQEQQLGKGPAARAGGPATAVGAGKAAVGRAVAGGAQARLQGAATAEGGAKAAAVVDADAAEKAGKEDGGRGSSEGGSASADEGELKELEAELERLEQQIVQAPTYGMNARALVLRAAELVARREAAKPTAAAAKPASSTAPAADPAPGLITAVKPLADAVPVTERAMVTYVPRSAIPRLVRQDSAHLLTGGYLALALHRAGVPEARALQAIAAELELRKAAAAAAGQHEMSLYRQVTSKIGYETLARKTQAEPQRLQLSEDLVKALARKYGKDVGIARAGASGSKGPAATASIAAPAAAASNPPARAGAAPASARPSPVIMPGTKQRHTPFTEPPSTAGVAARLPRPLGTIPPAAKRPAGAPSAAAGISRLPKAGAAANRAAAAGGAKALAVVPGTGGGGIDGAGKDGVAGRSAAAAEDIDALFAGSDSEDEKQICRAAASPDNALATDNGLAAGGLVGNGKGTSSKGPASLGVEGAVGGKRGPPEGVVTDDAAGSPGDAPYGGLFGSDSETEPELRKLDVATGSSRKSGPLPAAVAAVQADSKQDAARDQAAAARQLQAAKAAAAAVLAAGPGSGSVEDAAVGSAAPTAVSSAASPWVNEGKTPAAEAGPRAPLEAGVGVKGVVSSVVVGGVCGVSGGRGSSPSRGRREGREKRRRSSSRSRSRSRHREKRREREEDGKAEGLGGRRGSSSVSGTLQSHPQPPGQPSVPGHSQGQERPSKRPAPPDAAEEPEPRQSLRQQVLAFVHATLEPLYRAGLLGKEPYKRVAAKTTERLLAAHPDDTTADFLVREHAQVSKFIMKMVERERELEQQQQQKQKQ